MLVICSGRIRVTSPSELRQMLPGTFVADSSILAMLLLGKQFRLKFTYCYMGTNIRIFMVSEVRRIKALLGRFM